MTTQTTPKITVGAYGRLLLLSHNNVKTVQKNHPDEFIGALRDIEALKARTALPFTTDEERRLAALAVLQAKGLFSESVKGQPTTTKAKRKRKATSTEVMPA